MNKQLAALIVGSIFMSAFSSCVKEEDKAKLDGQTEQFNTDADKYKEESDQADSDINNSINDNGSFGGRVGGVLSSPLCGVTIDSSQLAQKILFYNFDGITPCFNPSRTRGGQIKVQLTTGTSWNDAGSVLTLTYINFKITRLSDNKSIMFNGQKTLKNMNGHNFIGFLLGTSTYKYQSRAFNVNVTYDDGSTATWNRAYITEWKNETTAVHTPISFTGIGDTTLNGYSNVDTWGMNRYGQNFTSYYTAPYYSNTYCGLWRPNSGTLTHHVNNADFTLTLGVDQSGNATTLDCAYGYKVTWTVNGATNNVVLSY